MKKAVLSLSGGMDSSSLLLHLLANGYEVTALGFDYGQKHKIELERATELVEYLNGCSQKAEQDQLGTITVTGKNFPLVKHQIIKLDGLSQLLNSALVEGGQDVPEGHYEQDNMKETVVPNRNKIFASLIQAVALSVATKGEKQTCAIAMGIHAGDHAIYPDCRQEFRDADDAAYRIGNWEAERVGYFTPYLEGDKFTILQDGEVLCKELYLDFNDSRHEVFGDSTLNSETSHSFTGSYTKYLKKGDAHFSTTVDGFYNNIANKIELIVTGPIQAKYGNIGTYQSVGGDLSQKILYKDFGLNGSFNYTGIYNGVDGSEKEFFFSPQVVVNPTYTWKKQNLSVNLFYNYFGRISRVFSNTDSANINVQQQDAYSMLDFTLNKSFMNKKLRLTLGARNILGVININANTTEVGAHTPSTTFISVSPGRTYFINVRYELFKKD